jgi:hypothetical protein
VLFAKFNNKKEDVCIENDYDYKIKPEDEKI